MPSPAFLQRLKERKLVQWALAYLAGAWVVYEVTDAVGGRWNLPDVLFQGLAVVLVFGFFVILVLAWYHGEKGRQRVSAPELLMVAALLVTAGGMLSVIGTRDGPSSAAVPRASLRMEDNRPGIAVLPFDNFSPNPDDAYFASGMHAEIITRLTKISALRVISRNSVMQYREVRKQTPEIAVELGVDYVLEGSARIAADQVRLTVQLIDAGRDEPLWFDDFDRNFSVDDLIRVQSEITRQIAQVINVVIDPAEQVRLEALPTKSFAAYKAYLLGKLEWSRRTGQGMQAAIEYSTRAIEEDPDFAQAYVGLANTLTVTPWYTDALPPREAWSRATTAAQWAADLDADLSETHVATGGIKMNYDWDWGGAETDFLKAIELDPNNTLAHHWYGYLLYEIGRFDEAIAQLQIALRSDPLSVTINRILGEVMTRAGRYDEALAQYRRAKELDPSWAGFEDFLALQYLKMGEYESVLEINPVSMWSIAALVALGRRDEALAMVEQFESSTLRGRNGAAVCLGDPDRVYPLLMQAYDERQPWLALLAYGASYEACEKAGSVRSDPRIRDLIRRMGFPE